VAAGVTDFQAVRDATGPRTVTKPAGATDVAPGASIQAALTAAGVGGKIWLLAGTHRITTPLVPLTNQTIALHPDAILSGAKDTTGLWHTPGTSTHGPYWQLDNQTQDSTYPNSSEFPTADFLPASVYDDVFAGDMWLIHVASMKQSNNNPYARSAVWYDRSIDKMITQFNPSHFPSMDAVVCTMAVDSNVSGVTIKGGTIQRFAWWGIRTVGSGWTITDVHFRQNHLGAIRASGASHTIGHNKIEQSGCLGIYTTATTNLICEYNELFRNNFLSYGERPVAKNEGGAKSVGGTNTIIRNNWSHDNDGDGWWLYFDNVDATVSTNVFEDNSRWGFADECNRGTEVTDCLIGGNGDVEQSLISGFMADWGFERGGMLNSTSQTEDVHNNIFELNASYSLHYLYETRTGSAIGSLVLANNAHHNNQHDFTWEAGTDSYAEVVSARGSDAAVATSSNTFTANTYHTDDTAQAWWRWPSGTTKTFTTWQALGFDAAGTHTLWAPTVIVLSGTAYDFQKFTVHPSELVRFDPNVSTTVTMHGNFIVHGTLEMKPANATIIHKIIFPDVDESIMVGNSMDVLDTDVGIWCMKNGVLDLQGTPRVGWKRTNTDATWLTGDELRSTPWAVGDNSTYATVTKGVTTLGTVVGPNGVTYTQEAMNLTRNVQLYGSTAGHAHLFIRSNQPQTIKYVEIRFFSPNARTGPGSNFLGDGGLLGRYSVHFHHCHDGSRGSVVTGVVARDATGDVFVPHQSHGITFEDCIAFNTSTANLVFGWDAGTSNFTNDITFHHCLVAGITGQYGAKQIDGFMLREGTDMVLQDCCVVGNKPGAQAAGFSWPSDANSSAINVWKTFEGNVAHNNSASGIRIWQNDSARLPFHPITNFVAFRNFHGITHGAYSNQYHFTNVVCFGNGESGLERLAITARDAFGAATLYDHCYFDGFIEKEHILQAQAPIVMRDVYFNAFPDARPYRIEINEASSDGNGNPVVTKNHQEVDYVRCHGVGADLEVTDVHVVTLPDGRPMMNAFSVFRFQRADGTAWQLKTDGTAMTIPQFDFDVSSVTVLGQGTITATGHRERHGQVSVAGTGAITGTGVRTPVGGAATVHGAATIVGFGSISASPRPSSQHFIPSRRFGVRKTFGSSRLRGKDRLRVRVEKIVATFKLRGSDGASRAGGVNRLRASSVVSEVRRFVSISGTGTISASGVVRPSNALFVRPRAGESLVSFPGLIASIETVLEADDALARARALGEAVITGGATTLSLTSAFTMANTAYQLVLEPSWQTTWTSANKTTTGATATFGVPCPTGGGTVRWRVKHNGS
jgi:hypothetical protein